MNDGGGIGHHHGGRDDGPLVTVGSVDDVVTVPGGAVATVEVDDSWSASGDSSGDGRHAPVPGDLEGVLLDIAVELISADIDDVDPVIDATLKRIGVSRDVHRAFLFQYDWGRRTASNTHEWCADGITPMIGALQSVPVDRFQQVALRHQRGEIVYVPSTRLLADDSFRALLDEQDVAATISVPLVDGGECVGFVGFDVVGREQLWAPEDQRLLGVLATLLVNVERRRRHEVALVVMRDLATANEALERFAGVVSHDLRTPLTSIRGFIDLVRSGRVSGKVADELLDRAVANVDRLSSLIDRLLGDAVAGRVVGTRDIVPLNAVLSQVLEQLSGPIAIRGAVIDAGDLPAVIGDGAQFVQLLQNLIGNALVHVPHDRRPHVRISARTAHDAVELVVADNGRGIAASERAAALRSFERLTGAERVEGSGLGLSICQRIVSAHGGSLSLGDAPGGGLAVLVRLPTRRHHD